MTTVGTLIAQFISTDLRVFPPGGPKTVHGFACSSLRRRFGAADGGEAYWLGRHFCPYTPS
jgi:hypothetical protein